MMFVMRKRCVTPFQTVQEETVLAVYPRLGEVGEVTYYGGSRGGM